MSDEHVDDLDARFEQLDKKSESLFQRCRLRSALRVARESTQLAKSEEQVVHYMRGLFDQMRFGHGLLDPALTKAAAIELIAILESEEQARRIQPDLDERHYHWVCSWMSACAYDNLAEATGCQAGYNSPGLHECINDGIQVCRRTGKLDCIKCFREYAADVYLAADDLDMVRHQCRTLREYRGDDQEKKDRRWSSHQKTAWLEILEGRLDQAQSELAAAAEFCRAPQVYLKYRSQLLVLADQSEVALLAGDAPSVWPATIAADDGTLSEIPEVAEWPRFELEQAKLQALTFVVGGNCERALEILTDWDRRLTQQQCRHEWFEIRLRLLAAYRMAGKMNRAQSLAKGLDAQARESQDYLTLRRLTRLMDESTVAVPVPSIAGFDRGPFAERLFVASAGIPHWETTGGNEAESHSNSAPQPVQQSKETSPLDSYLNDLTQRLVANSKTYAQRQGEVQPDLPPDSNNLEDYRQQCQNLLEEIVSQPAAAIADARDAARLVYLLQYVAQDGETALRGWDWSLELMEKFRNDAVVLNVVASLGRHLLAVEEAIFRSKINLLDLTAWFRESLQIDPQHARNHLRAGEFFREQGELGEAERSLARAFRLNRTESASALALSQIYMETDRPRDSLNVLDMCLRDGSDDPQIAWEAGVQALNQGQFDAVVTYMDRHIELTGDRPWLWYYRAWGLLETQRFEECLAALDRESALNPTSNIHLLILGVCAREGLAQRQAAWELLSKVLESRLSTIDMLSISGFVRLFTRLWKSVAGWDVEDSLRRVLVQRLLETGLTPDDYFTLTRDREPLSGGVNFYRVRVRQPLDARWPESFCPLPGQAEWSSYFMEWGVLSLSEDDAREKVLAAQSRCYPLPAEIVGIELVGENFQERPGIVWQGYRWPETAVEGDEDQTVET